MQGMLVMGEKNDAVLTRIAILGAGRMSRSILQVIRQNKSCIATGVWARHAPDLPDITVSADLPSIIDDADVLIDFTLAAATLEVLQEAVAAGKPLVCGVSGLDDAQNLALGRAATKIPLLHDRNMSYGIAVLTRVLLQVGKAFGDDFTTEIHETHHRHKKDAPSGTALLLGEAIAKSRGLEFRDAYHYDPDGAPADFDNAIDYFVSRHGEVPGKHRVVFRNASERVQLCHDVSDRSVFAEGAVKAAQWLPQQPAGLYQMLDLLDA